MRLRIFHSVLKLPCFINDMENKHRIFMFFWLIIFIGYGETVSHPCTFDDGFCNLQHVENDNFKLVWRREKASTTNKGLDSDHTSGVGYYIYINSNNELANKQARLSSSGWKSLGTYCLSFWYYMYGRDTDILRIAVKEKSSTWKALIYKTKYQQKKWRFNKIVFNTEVKFKIFIDALVKNDTDDIGYIAVDDIQMFSGVCPKNCSNPTPDNGKAVTGDIWVGSTVNITCKESYGIQGNSSIVCLDNQKWSDSTTCQPVDCNIPILERKDMLYYESVQTTYNTTIKLSCSAGFTLTGSSSITCMANGKWSEIPQCIINNCSDPTPESGKVNSTDFKIGSRIQVTCDTGYELIGDPLIVCQTKSSWTDNPVCKIIECLKPMLKKGLLEPNGTTWYTNQFIILACADGYNLRGNTTITCQDSRKWTTLPFCDANEDSSPSALIAIAVTVPVVVIGIIVVTIVVVCRKRNHWCMKGDKTREHDINWRTDYPNNSYGNHVRNEDTIMTEKSLEQDTEYAIIAEKNPTELKDVAHYNTVKYEDDVRNDEDYDHMDSSFEPVLDDTYSHIRDKNIISNEKQSNQTSNYFTNAAFQGNDDEYNHINQSRPSESGKQHTITKSTEEQESDYDHAKAGGGDLAILDLDEYSHLNTVVKGQGHGEARLCNRTLDISKRVERKRKTEMEEPTDDTPEYFNVEKVYNPHTPDEGRHYFVLEKEQNPKTQE